MDLKQYFGGDDRGVSPVIGVILMVAITVILAAVIATFVMNMGPSESTPANANWDWDLNESYPGMNLTLSHEGGGAASPSEYAISIEGTNQSSTLGNSDYQLESSSSEDLTAGDEVKLNPYTLGTGGTNIDFTTSNTTVELIWNDPEGDQSQIIDTWEP